MALIWGKVDPKDLEPEMVTDLAALFGQKGAPDFQATYGYRSLALQKSLWLPYKAWLDYKAGRGAFAPEAPKAAPPGQSAHNYGLAIDVVLDADAGKPGLQASWDIDDPRWQWLFDALENHPRLHSGVSFGDGGHIEKRDWKTHRNWKA
jgi:hypothetical protein